MKNNSKVYVVRYESDEDYTAVATDLAQVVNIIARTVEENNSYDYVDKEKLLNHLTSRENDCFVHLLDSDELDFSSADEFDVTVSYLNQGFFF